MGVQIRSKLKRFGVYVDDVFHLNNLRKSQDRGHSWMTSLEYSIACARKYCYLNCGENRQAVAQAVQNCNRNHIAIRSYALVQFLEHFRSDTNTETKKAHGFTHCAIGKRCIYKLLRKMWFGLGEAGNGLIQFLVSVSHVSFSRNDEMEGSIAFRNSHPRFIFLHCLLSAGSLAILPLTYCTWFSSANVFAHFAHATSTPVEPATLRFSLMTFLLCSFTQKWDLFIVSSWRLETTSHKLEPQYFKKNLQWFLCGSPLQHVQVVCVQIPNELRPIYFLQIQTSRCSDFPNSTSRDNFHQVQWSTMRGFIDAEALWMSLRTRSNKNS